MSDLCPNCVDNLADTLAAENGHKWYELTEGEQRFYRRQARTRMERAKGDPS